MRIGTLTFDRPVFLAPMAGITNLPFRTIARRCGCALAFTEMVSVNGLVRRSQRTFQYLDSAPSDRPLGVQLFGADPELMAEGARIVTAHGADLIDINMGCPVKKVIRTGAGAALLQDPEKVSRIVRAVRKASPLPLTVKIRSGWRRSTVNAPLIAVIAEAEGADALIVHPRTADQGFSGTADWTIIQSVKRSVGIPVIGNGDIRHGGDAGKMMQMTACDGVMIGRAALGNPWIFKDTWESRATWPSSVELGSAAQAEERHEREATGSQGRSGRKEESAVRRFPVSLAERAEVIREHLDLEATYAGERGGVRGFRKHLLWYTRGLHGSAVFRQQMSSLQDREIMLRALTAYFADLNNGLDFS